MNSQTSRQSGLVRIAPENVRFQQYVAREKRLLSPVMLTPYQIRGMPYDERVRQIGDLLAKATMRLLRDEELQKHRRDQLQAGRKQFEIRTTDFAADETERRILGAVQALAEATPGKLCSLPWFESPNGHAKAETTARDRNSGVGRENHFCYLSGARAESEQLTPVRPSRARPINSALAQV